MDRMMDASEAIMQKGKVNKIGCIRHPIFQHRKIATWMPRGMVTQDQSRVISFRSVHQIG